MYFHNGDQRENLHAANPQQMRHSATQHDGIVRLFMNAPINVDKTCGEDGWQTIKTSNTIKDLLVRAVANPVWSTSTVQFDCKRHAVADRHPAEPSLFRLYPE